VEVILKCHGGRKKKLQCNTRMKFLERGRVKFMELENKHLCIKEEKNSIGKNEWGKAKNERREGNYDKGCKYIASSATRIFSSTPIGNPYKEKN
jgi:hypothetical protein